MIFQRIKDYLSLKKIKTFKTSKDLSVIKLFAHVRNEFERLPFFFKYYRALGVSEFFIVDNASTDQTLAYLLEQDDVHVFKTTEAFSKAGQGVKWTNTLMKRYAIGQWCITADIDEYFIYPHSDILNLFDLCKFLDQQGASAVKAIFLDMYSDQAIGDCHYVSGQSPFKFSQYFERIYCEAEAGAQGGTQRRIIGHNKMLWKCPLIKVSRDNSLKPGHHTAVNVTLSDLIGTVLHFPFDSSFKKRCEIESQREEYAHKASKYKAYHQLFLKNPDLTLFCEESLKYEGHSQLQNLNMMKSSEAFDRYVAKKQEGKKTRVQNQAYRCLSE